VAPACREIYRPAKLDCEADNENSVQAQQHLLRLFSTNGESNKNQSFSEAAHVPRFFFIQVLEGDAGGFQTTKKPPETGGLMSAIAVRLELRPSTAS